MVEHPEWRLKNSTGGDIHMFPGIWGYNLTVPAMRAAWVA